MKKRVGEMMWQPAPEIGAELTEIVGKLDFKHIDPKRLICFRSFGSSSRARARIWSLPRIWQTALKVKAHYCIEILSEKFDHLKEDDKTKVLIHELLHIPKNFSGALLSHRHGRYHRLDSRTVETLFKSLRHHD